MGEVLVLTDNLRLHRFSLIQRRLWTNNRRRLVKPMKKGIHEAKTRSWSTTYRFHCAYRLHHWPSFLLGLCTFGTGEEWTEEARFFLLSLDVEILVVVDLSWKELATLWVRSGWRGLSITYRNSDRRFRLAFLFNNVTGFFFSLFITW